MVLVMYVSVVSGQHDAQFSMFYFNKLNYNPAYAGAKEVLTTSAIYRHQWAGLEGAPRSLIATAHAPFMKKRGGLGVSILADKIGDVNTTMFDVSYAYRLRLSETGTLSFGLKGRVENSKTNLYQAKVLDQGDELLPSNAISTLKPNFGFGMYYTNSKFYAGVSVPSLLKSALYAQGEPNGPYRAQRSAYLMAGSIHKLSDNIFFKPAVLLTYNPAAPFEVDINTSFFLMDALWLGATYRLGDSINGVVQYQFNSQIKAGLAVDMTMSELQQYTGGGFEMMLEYSFFYEDDNLRHLRFF